LIQLTPWRLEVDCFNLADASFWNISFTGIPRIWVLLSLRRQCNRDPESRRRASRFDQHNWSMRFRVPALPAPEWRACLA